MLEEEEDTSVMAAIKEVSAARSSVKSMFFMHTSPFLPLGAAHLDTKSYHVDLPWHTTATARSRVSFVTFPKTTAVLSNALN